VKTKCLILAILFLIFLTTVSALTVDSVRIDPSEVSPGDVADIDIDLENNLEEDVTDVSISLDLSDPTLPFAPYQSSNEVSVDKIRDDRNKIVKFTIITLNDAESGIYKIPVKISYSDQEGDVQPDKTSLISVTVNSDPILGISLEDGLLLKGRENEIAVKVVNKGLSDIKFLEIELEKGSFYTILSKESIYIGDIDSDDFDSAEFRVYFKENIPSKVSIPVTVKYRDAFNNEHVEEIELERKIYSEDQAIKLGLIQKNNTRTYVIVVIVLIVAYVVYRKLKKRRRKNK